ncbi:MAG: hypothetical protein ACJAS9_000888 [Polaribacter sp.]|jgi:hypothetical protein
MDHQIPLHEEVMLLAPCNTRQHAIPDTQQIAKCSQNQSTIADKLNRTN